MSIPDGFVPFGSSLGNIVDPAQQAQAISWATGTVTLVNTHALATYQGQCATWLQVNLQNRGLGQPLSLKPVQPIELTVVTIDDPSGNGTIWFGTVEGKPMGSPCPDLPALITNDAPANTPNIGICLGGPWYQCFPNDTMPNDSIVTVGSGWVTPFGTSGSSFASGAKPPSGQYAKVPNVIGAWYLKVA